MAPITQGPEYILYNTITDYRRSACKFSLSSTGHAWICHNTTWPGSTYTAAVWPSGTYSNVHFRDNILTGNGLPCVNDETGESQTGSDFDGDLLYATGSPTLFQWKSVRYANLASVHSGTGFEACGATGDPLFVSPATGDFTLQAASPAADAGTAVPGVDDCYGGTAPDIGSIEFCGPDGLVAVAAALECAEAEPGLVTVTWYVTDVTSGDRVPQRRRRLVSARHALARRHRPADARGPRRRCPRALRLPPRRVRGRRRGAVRGDLSGRTERPRAGAGRRASQSLA